MTKQEIGAILMELRENSGKTREEVADLLGKSVKAIGHWETGYAQPDANTLFLLCTIYDADISESFGFSKSKVAKPSRDAMILARDYDCLDVYGKRQVRTTADTEMQRMREMEEDASNKLRCYIIKKQEYRMSAGTGQEAHAGETEEAELVKRPPAGASYIARIAGNSMEPTYRDGDWVFVHEQEEPVRKGEIGVFLMDGQQWVKELGDGELISHNSSEYEPIPFSDGVKCQGKVIGICDSSYFE